jgi:hypothetical protein
VYFTRVNVKVDSFEDFSVFASGVEVFDFKHDCSLVCFVSGVISGEPSVKFIGWNLSV